MPNLFIIAGCNGAGKTTSSFTTLPKWLQVKEFVNADEIARGLSPFQPEKVSIEAGKIMLKRIDELIDAKQDFAFETTLSTRSFVQLCREVKSKGYTVSIVFFWLRTPQMAIDRVAQRVAGGGHDIPIDTIIRRYNTGLQNFVTLYQNEVDNWYLFDNSDLTQELIAEGTAGKEPIIYNSDKWLTIQSSV